MKNNCFSTLTRRLQVTIVMSILGQQLVLLAGILSLLIGGGLGGDFLLQMVGTGEGSKLLVSLSLCFSLSSC